MVSMPSKVWKASRPAMCLTTRWSSKVPLPPRMASARRHRFADIRDTRNRRATSRSLAPASTSSAASRTPLKAAAVPGSGVPAC